MTLCVPVDTSAIIQIERLNVQKILLQIGTV